MPGPELVFLPDGGAVAREAAGRFVACAQAAASARGRFTVALAGGSTPTALYRLLAQPPYRAELPWPRTLVFFGDERCVPPDHPDSNYHLAQANLLAHVPVDPAHVYRLAGDLPGDAAAGAYAETLRQVLGPELALDLVLLGMGEDGHTVSLFPGMPALAETAAPVVWTPAPAYVRPAVSRLTLTLPVLNAARQVLFLVTGSAKAAAVSAVLGASPPDEPLPAARVVPLAGKLTWLLDQAAAAGLAAS